MLLSLASSQVAGVAQANLSRANDNSALSISRLSSGNRIVRAADDVAALSVSVQLSTSVTTLKQSLNNALQAGSYLQIADAALSNIDQILSRMGALSVQSSSGALTSNERGFLNQEFQNLFAEIDRIAENSNFNGLSVLQQDYDNLVEGSKTITTEATKAQGQLVFTGNVGAGETIRLNKYVVTEGVDFTAGATTQATVQRLADALNAHTDPLLGEATYEAAGNTLIITAKVAGDIGNYYTIDELASTANGSFNVIGQDIDAGTSRWTLQHGSDGALNMNGTKVGGDTSGILTAQTQTKSEIRYFSSGATNAVDGNFLRIDNGTAGNVVFRFRQNPNLALDPPEVQIGGTLEETMRNLSVAMNNYLNTNPSTDNIHGIRQVYIYRDGDELAIESKLPGIPYDITGILATDALDIGEGGVGLSLDAPNQTAAPYNFSSGDNTGGVNTVGVVNEDFVGTISGFTADHLADDNVRMRVTVGEHTYTAVINDTAPLADTTVHFSSEDGGFFRLELDAFSGMEVRSQSDADRYAQLMDDAFADLNFYQERELDFVAFNELGDNTRIITTLDDYSNIVFDDIRINASVDGDTATIEFDLNGETFTALRDIGEQIGSFERFEFIGQNDTNRKITLITEGDSYDLRDAEFVENLQTELTKALEPTRYEVNDRLIERSFQVGITSSQEISITLNYVSTEQIFNGASVDISTVEAANDAYDAVKVAIDYITAVRAQVGSLQSRFDTAADAAQDAIQNQDQARGVLEDTDIASESTLFASHQVKMNASISTLAQVNSLRTSLITTLLQA